MLGLTCGLVVSFHSLDFFSYSSIVASPRESLTLALDTAIVEIFGGPSSELRNFRTHASGYMREYHPEDQ